MKTVTSPRLHPAIRQTGRLAATLLMVGGLQLALRAQPASAVPGTIEGRVLNPVTGDYLLNARVSVQGTDRVALTDSTGAYQLDNLPAGQIALRVIHPGLDDEERVVALKPGETARADAVRADERERRDAHQWL